jgi:hypothetical protein
MVETTYEILFMLQVTCVEFYMKGDFTFLETSMSGVLGREGKMLYLILFFL